MQALDKETVRCQRGRVRVTLPGETATLLSEGWTLTLTSADAYDLPSDIPAHLESLPADVPGTVAQALEVSGEFDRFAPEALNDKDAWYRLTLISEVKGRAILRFDGLATVTEVFFQRHIGRRIPEHVRGSGIG